MFSWYRGRDVLLVQGKVCSLGTGKGKFFISLMHFNTTSPIRHVGSSCTWQLFHAVPYAVGFIFVSGQAFENLCTPWLLILVPLPPILMPHPHPPPPQVRRVFASLANGTLCIFSCKSLCGGQGAGGGAPNSDDCKVVVSDDVYRAEAEDWSDPLFLQLDVPRKSVKCMTFVGTDQLWCGCGNGISVVDIVNLKVVRQIPVFVKNMALVNEVVSDGNAVWGVGLHLSCVLQWDVKTYSLVSVFDCSSVDPTGRVVTTDPREFEDIFDPDKAKPLPDQETSEQQSAADDRFDVRNEPLNQSQSSQKISQPALRRNLTTVYHTREKQPSVLRRTQAVQASSKKKIPLHQKSTRTTSLLVVDDTLWIGRGMGDIIILDISRGPTHGKVLARLATEGCQKYGNKSYHKLVVVAGEYVVSSQWLEPIDMHKDQGTEGSGHQEVTVWEAWSHKQIGEYDDLRAALLSTPS